MRRVVQFACRAAAKIVGSVLGLALVIVGVALLVMMIAGGAAITPPSLSFLTAPLLLILFGAVRMAWPHVHERFARRSRNMNTGMADDPKPSASSEATAYLAVDLNKMQDVVRDWVAFMEQSVPRAFEVRDTRELPRSKGEITLALYTVHHRGKTQELRNSALVYLDLLCQFQDDVGIPVLPPREPSIVNEQAARWKSLYGKVIEDRARLRAIFKTPPTACRTNVADQ